MNGTGAVPAPPLRRPSAGSGGDRRRRARNSFVRVRVRTLLGAGGRVVSSQHAASCRRRAARARRDPTPRRARRRDAVRRMDHGAARRPPGPARTLGGRACRPGAGRGRCSGARRQLVDDLAAAARLRTSSSTLVDAGPSWREVTGPVPVAWLWSLPPVRERANMLEYLVHHEDVRRAAPDWAAADVARRHARGRLDAAARAGPVHAARRPGRGDAALARARTHPHPRSRVAARPSSR